MREILDTTKTKSQNSENVAGLRKRFELIKNKIEKDKKWKNKLGATRSFWASEPQGSRISILGTHSSLSPSLSFPHLSLSHICIILSLIPVLFTLSHLWIILSLSLSSLCYPLSLIFILFSLFLFLSFWPLSLFWNFQCSFSVYIKFVLFLFLTQSLSSLFSLTFSHFLKVAFLSFFILLSFLGWHFYLPFSSLSIFKWQKFSLFLSFFSWCNASYFSLLLSETEPLLVASYG